MKCTEQRGAGMTLTARGQVAHGYDDCEGDLLTRARALSGPACVISAEMARAACEGVYARYPQQIGFCMAVLDGWRGCLMAPKRLASGAGRTRTATSPRPGSRPLTC
jgi:hypothetical protein